MSLPPVKGNNTHWPEPRDSS